MISPDFDEITTMQAGAGDPAPCPRMSRWAALDPTRTFEASARRVTVEHGRSMKGVDAPNPQTKSPPARHGRAGFGALTYRTLTRVTLSGRTSCGRAGSFAGCGRESDASELFTVLIAHDQCAMSLAPNTMSPQRCLRLASSPGHALVIEITA